jgi:hypothetical protein
MQIWDVQLPREKCYHYLGKCTFSMVNVYFLCLPMIGKCTGCACVCVCVCVCARACAHAHSTFETVPEFTDIIYMNSLLQFTGFATVNKEMYINTLHRIRDAVRRKCPQQWRTNSSFLLYDNAPAHRSVFVKNFSSTNNVTTLQHSPYSPDLTPADFYLFPRHH